MREIRQNQGRVRRMAFENESRAARMIRGGLRVRTAPHLYSLRRRAARRQSVARSGPAIRRSAPVPVWTWSLTEGMRANGEPRRTGRRASARGPRFHRRAPRPPPSSTSRISTSRCANPPEIRRRLRDVYENCLDQRKFVVITSPVRFIPEELERSIMFLELRPPDLVELVEFLREESAPAADAADRRRRPAPGGARAAGADARRSALRAAPRPGRAAGAWDRESLPALLEEKRLLVNRSGVIEFIADGDSIWARSAASKA